MTEQKDSARPNRVVNKTNGDGSYLGAGEPHPRTKLYKRPVVLGGVAATALVSIIAVTSIFNMVKQKDAQIPTVPCTKLGDGGVQLPGGTIVDGAHVKINKNGTATVKFGSDERRCTFPAP